MMSFAREQPLALNDAAQFLGVHRRTIENWIKLGLEVKRCGRLIFTSREAIDRFAVAPVRNEPTPTRTSDRDGAEKRRQLKEQFGL